VSSSFIREISSMGGDVQSLVPEAVRPYLLPHVAKRKG